MGWGEKGRRGGKGEGAGEEEAQAQPAGQGRAGQGRAGLCFVSRWPSLCEGGGDAVKAVSVWPSLAAASVWRGMRGPPGPDRPAHPRVSARLEREARVSAAAAAEMRLAVLASGLPETRS